MFSRATPGTNYQSGFSKKQSPREVLYAVSLLGSIIPRKEEWDKWTESEGGDSMRQNYQTDLYLASGITYPASMDLWEALWTTESQESWLEGRVVKIVFTGFQSQYLKLFFHGFQLPLIFRLCDSLILQPQRECSGWETRAMVRKNEVRLCCAGLACRDTMLVTSAVADVCIGGGRGNK